MTKMAFMTKTSVLFTVFITAGCATTKPPAELVDARSTYRQAEVEATDTAPTALHDARVALDAAEKAFAAEPSGAEVKDRAYIAQRRAQIAIAEAALYSAHAERQASNAKLRALGATAASDLRETQGLLTDAEKRARMANKDVTALKSSLTESQSNASGLESNLRVAEVKADGLRTNLHASKSESAKLQSNLDASNSSADALRGDLQRSQAKSEGLSAALVEEQKARRDAETRLAATLMAMENLQSVKEEPRGLVITLSGAVMFASNKSELLPAARAALDNVAEALLATPDRAITVEGHTDSHGTQESNMSLSQRRADSVQIYLLSRGITPASISSKGYGSERPIGNNSTPEGRANNRRVEIVLAPLPTEAR